MTTSTSQATPQATSITDNNNTASSNSNNHELASTDGQVAATAPAAGQQAPGRPSLDKLDHSQQHQQLSPLILIDNCNDQPSGGKSSLTCTSRSSGATTSGAAGGAPRATITATSLAGLANYFKRLRFIDPDLEQKYHNYYAQAKRDLSPTAIQISTTPQSTATSSLSTSGGNANDSTAAPPPSQIKTTSDLNAYSRTLIWPISIQLIIFVIAIAMQRTIRAELNRSPGAGQRRSSKRPSSASLTYNSASFAVSGSSQSSSEDNNGGDDDDHEQSHRRSFKASSRPPSTSSSATATAAAAASSASSASSSSSSSDESTSLKNKHHSSGRRRRHKRGGRNGKAYAKSFPARCRLSLPYLLWLCQLVQMASGLWLQQSPFVTYATLLLYSYAIYVILPIRLQSCVLLAIGLSLIEPALDFVLLLNLSSTFNLNNYHYPSPGMPITVASGDEIITAAANSDEQLVQPPKSDLSNQFDSQTFNNSDSKTQTVLPTSSYPSANAIIDSALSIPMTSHFSKLWSFMMLIIGVNIIGIMSYFFYERQQRAAFLETQLSLETKLTLEKESREQERLLLSILPKHLASEIRQDLGAVVTGQFKKIYMSRHENVSILFADIVGFTAISSNCPAAELVKTLNELFARFDKLAEKYHQLRIKILGDCYYAISGAPQERPDHAVLCVHMGLSMVEAIKSVRSRTKSTVDMRVGVHTGGVLAGVLGQRQWQFDVYSRDVELANKMESSGLPGRVHISHVTLRFLNDEFEVSDGDGASREEALRLANIKTYFIDRVKKPYPEGTLDALEVPAARLKMQQKARENVVITIGELDRVHDQASKQEVGQSKESADAADGPSAPPGATKRRHDYASETQATTARSSRRKRKRRSKHCDEAKQQQQQPADPLTPAARQHVASATTVTTDTERLVSATSNGQKQRNDSSGLDNQIKQFSLNFSNRHFERQFRSTSDITSCISLVGLPITLLCAFAAYAHLYKVDCKVTIAYLVGSLVLLLVVLLCLLPYLWLRREQAGPANSRKQRFLHSLLKFSDTMGQSAWVKLVLSALMTLIWLTVHLVGVQRTVAQFQRDDLVAKFEPHATSWANIINGPHYHRHHHQEQQQQQQQLYHQLGQSSMTRHAISVFSADLLNYFTITCALAITAITRISFLVKTIIINIVILNQVILNKTLLADILAARSLAPSPEHSSGARPAGAMQNGSLRASPATNHFVSAESDKYSLIEQHLVRLLAECDQYVFGLTLFCVCWALLLMNRQFELTNRRLFLWRKIVEERKEKVSDMRRKNEALVYNILPPNVAKIFLGKRQLDDEELYSKSYDAVGVLFAAMPNFGDFYTEESVNNQGLECLRFLNEVISDYDALLDQERFKNIIKIKTMSSTYMAASGLYEGDARADSDTHGVLGGAECQLPSSSSPPCSSSCSPSTPTPSHQKATQMMIDSSESEAEIRSKWGHLEQLTEFALALKETLNNINKESFNNFVLRIGINQGPITAGVIGVKKPHFDIWGNTVNVASRMESTGRAGSIQVVEETASILRHFGFQFDQRGLILVKGKGKLMTYYLTGRPAQAATGAAAALTTAPGQPTTVTMGQSRGQTSSPNFPVVEPADAYQDVGLGRQDTDPTRNSSLSIRSQDSHQVPQPNAHIQLDTDKKRMYITPARRDYDSDADIHLV